MQFLLGSLGESPPIIHAGRQQIAHAEFLLYAAQACVVAALRRDQMKYTGIPSSTMIKPGHVYCGL